MLNNIKNAFKNTMLISFGTGLLIGYFNLLHICFKANNDIAITVLLMLMIFLICLLVEFIDNKERR